VRSVHGKSRQGLCSVYILYTITSVLLYSNVSTLPTYTRQDCRVLLVHVSGLSRNGDKSRLSATENFKTEHV